jgi:radical SAM protein with 4Fe4S-binding SPASM domain
MSCPTLSYSDFSRRLGARVRGKRVPITGSFELTFRCNLRCKHCYLDGQHDGVPGLQELSFAEIREILDQVADAGCLWLLLTGGEPLVRDDFLDIYTYAKRKGFLVSLFTNGTLLTPEIADVLAEYPPFKIEITLYGRTRETYERVTGIPGSHARCMRGIELLMERDLPLRLKTMLMTLNKHELGAMEAFAEDLGVRFKFDPMLNAESNGAHTPLQYRLSPEEIVEVEMEHPERMAEWQAYCERTVGKPFDDDYLYTCGAGVHMFHIDPYGRLHLCMLARQPGYDLREGSFEEGWADALPVERYRVPSSDYQCNQCALLPLCGQCPGWADVENGEPEQPVVFLCRVAHERAKVLGILTDATLQRFRCFDESVPQFYERREHDRKEAVREAAG